MLILRSSIVQKLVIAQSHLILTLERVDEPKVAEVRHDAELVGQVHVDNVERRAEHHEEDEYHNKKRLDADKRLLDQADEERRIIEEAQPIVDLEPQTDD